MGFNVNQPAYVSLRDTIAERTSSVAAWVGAGLSAAAGLPTWPELKEQLLATLMAKIESLEDEDRSRAYKKYVVIRDEEDYWLVFQMLKDALGPTSFKQAIRERLQTSVRSIVPMSYRFLRRLNVKGVLNLNLDRIATRAFIEEGGPPPTEFSGEQAGKYFHVFQSPRPFIVNLHGHHEDASTWVLTRDERIRAERNASLSKFVDTCLLTNVVMFVGMTVDDVAMRSHLKRLTGLDVDWGVHYWVTDRSDSVTDAWAEENGLRVIRYSPRNGHAELMEMFQDLVTYTPEEQFAEPVVASLPLASRQPPEPAELAREDAEEIRRTLNALAQEILTDQSADSYERFEQFCEHYDEAIYRAWYTTTKEDRNSLLGFTLVDEIAVGAFGRVYRAHTPDGRAVAIKVLREEVRKRGESLQSFRRGVRSMKILETHELEGMVEFLEASEIPTFVVMELVDGPTLREVVEARQVDEWSTILKISVELASVIHRAHTLPERVLHRDLRPSNIMLRNFWHDGSNWSLVVLDFDLSWHRGAYEVSVLHGQTSVGYMAPEQIQRIDGVSTRHAGVDSFGLGMTLFFMLAGRDPVSQEHRHADWETTVSSVASGFECHQWRSLPRRFARLIKNATRHRQALRWDLGQIEGELKRLEAVATKGGTPSSAELLVEEVVTRTQYGSRYDWDEDRLTASVTLSSGLRIEVQAEESTREVVMVVQWASSGDEDRKRVGKWLPDRADRVRASLEGKKWSIEELSVGVRNFNLRCSLGVDEVVAKLDVTSSLIDEIAELLSFN